MELIENKTEIQREDHEPAKKRKGKNSFNEKANKLKRNKKRSRIIIRNISYKTTEDTLKKHFEQFGQINELNLLKRPDGKLVGCAFIQYETVNQAAKAIFKANNKEFLGRPVFVDWAVGKNEYEKKVGGKIKTEKVEEEIKLEEKPDDQSAEDEIQVETKTKSTDDEGDKGSESHEESEGEYSDDEDIKEASGSELDTKEDVKVKAKQKFVSNDVVEGCTVFIKNVPFDATSEDLKKVCRQFGPVYYALINIDPISEHSKGTAFVKFKTKESADLCLQAGEEFLLMDTVMEPFPALSREDIRQRIESSKRKEPTDSRNLYLAKEGLIMAGSKAAEGVSASDMAKRHKLEQIKTQILKNLNRFVSKNRLSIHNLPLHYDNEKLRKAVQKFTGLRTHECRIMRENKPTTEHPEGKSKGFGFVSFKTHQEALTALRKLNNNPSVFGPVNRPIVAFSIEDRSVHNIKQKRLKKSQESNPTFKRKLEKQKAKKKEKKEKRSKLTDDKTRVRKDVKQKNKHQSDRDDELADYAGMPAKPGSFIRMRSTKKITAQAKEHAKKTSILKKIEKRKKEKLILQREKKQIDRPKQGKKKGEKDNFSFLVNKYKRLINSAAAESEVTKSKRSKWYID